MEISLTSICAGDCGDWAEDVRDQEVTLGGSNPVLSLPLLVGVRSSSSLSGIWYEREGDWERDCDLDADGITPHRRPDDDVLLFNLRTCRMEQECSDSAFTSRLDELRISKHLPLKTSGLLPLVLKSDL